MTIEAALKTHLQGDGTISGLVGDRVFPALVPQGKALPAVTYQQIGGLPMTDLSGADGALINYRIQVNSWADGYMAAQALAEAVRVRMKTAASNFKAVLTLQQDVFEESPRRFGVYQDYSIWYRTA